LKQAVTSPTWRRMVKAPSLQKYIFPVSNVFIKPFRVHTCKPVIENNLLLSIILWTISGPICSSSGYILQDRLHNAI
jgi:hypothetical protein